MQSEPWDLLPVFTVSWGFLNLKTLAFLELEKSSASRDSLFLVPFGIWSLLSPVELKYKLSMLEQNDATI